MSTSFAILDVTNSLLRVIPCQLFQKNTKSLPTFSDFYETWQNERKDYLLLITEN